MTLSRLSTLLLSMLVSSSQLHAQAVESKQTERAKPSTAETKLSKDAEAERIARQRRSQARSLLIALAVDARTFRDQPLRARSLARIADALWRVDAEQARIMFRKAWEAAEIADQESRRKLQDEVNQQKSRTGGSFAINLPPNLRREVLQLVARQDRALGEEFLEKLKVEKQDEADDFRSLSDAANQRLGVATELLKAGDVERALQFADPILGTVNAETINFLSFVREKDPAAADARYGALLTQSAMNPQADANTVSLLSSYIFTPHLMITFTGSGTTSSQSASKIVPAEVSPELRTAFFNTAASILLKPLPPPGQEQGTAGVEGKYLVMKRMLPFFEQAASPELTQSLRNHLEALGALVSDNTSRRDDAWMRRGVRPERTFEEREQQILNQIERAKTSDERDALYIELAYHSLRTGDLRAREFIEKIEDTELHKQARAYVDGTLATQLVPKKKVEPLLELLTKGELTHLQKAWVFTSVARELVKTDRQKALDLVEAGAAEARRIDGSNADRPRAILAVANALNEIDPSRAWDATFDAVKAANSAEGFTGEDGELVLKFQSKGMSSVSNHDIAEFDVAGIFTSLAIRDYERAVELARGFQGEGPRAVATIAIARAVLEPKKPPVAKD